MRQPSLTEEHNLTLWPTGVTEQFSAGTYGAAQPVIADRSIAAAGVAR
jgi:hypothetical protein